MASLFSGKRKHKCDSFVNGFRLDSAFLFLLYVLLLGLSSCDGHTSSSSSVHTTSIPHTAKTGHYVASVTYWGQSFSLQDQGTADVAKFFTILTNGDVVTTADISHLKNKKLTLIVNNDMTGESWREEIKIHVKNGDNILVFAKKQYQGHVLENQPADSLLEGLRGLRASLGTKYPIVHYKISRGDTSLFYISKNSHGHVEIRTKAALDREALSQHHLTIKAWVDDPQIRPIHTQVQVVVEDENDNIPQFETKAYTFSLMEETATDTVIGYVMAIDPDIGRLRYKMIDSHPYFSIEENSGGIILLKKPTFYARSYDFDVMAEDADGKPSSPVKVHVEVELDGRLRYHPGSQHQHLRHKRSLRSRGSSFPVKEVEIPESSSVRTLIRLENNGNRMFRIEEPVPEMLMIHPTQGEVYLRDGMSLDYEKNSEINFKVVVSNAQDNMIEYEQSVRIKLTDMNDEIPRFVNLPRPFLATVSANAAPGTSVYQLMAQDDDEESLVRYILESGGEDRFQVDPETGVVRTRGNQPFRMGKEYEIGVSAQDMRAQLVQKSPTHSLKIMVGSRDPQFFENQYVASVKETAAEQDKVIDVRAFSHQNFPITYELLTESGGKSNEFAINQESGTVDLMRRLNYEKDPHRYYLKVKAIENGRPARTSTVNLIVNLIDMNDNAPIFPLSQYIVQRITETVHIGTDIIQVTATDLDSVTNSQLTYSVNDANFTVQTLNNIGYIKTAKRLDYDRSVDHTYNFTVIAKDNGEIPRSGSAMVRVTVTNINDEKPVFTQPIEHVQVSEDAETNTVVHVVQAFDPDGDHVTYSFEDGRTNEGPFSISRETGIITLVAALDKQRGSYTLNVTATDDGSCCGGTSRRTAKGLVRVMVKDINNNAPRFPDCGVYNPVVLENMNLGTSVKRVSAEDLDTGDNGNVTYSLVKSNDQSSDRFTIDAITGILRTAEVFDRELKTGVTDYGVTVRAIDQGRPSLAGFCSFRVKIGDVNDNPPVFDLPDYETSLEENSAIGKRVIQVYATDRDTGDNGRVEYYMRRDPSGFFRVHANTGWITVYRPMSGKKNVTLEIEARDTGIQPRQNTVRVSIKITQTMNAYPQWVEDYTSTPIRIAESMPPDTRIKYLRAVSSIDDQTVNYVIQPGETPEQNNPRAFHSRLNENTNEMELLTYASLDYEKLKRYTLTIKASNRAAISLHNDTRVTIEITDVNDEIPEFVGLDENGRYIGSVAENLRSGAPVIAVTAVDRDTTPEYKSITYSIKPTGTDYDKFRIDPYKGQIETTTKFDRELQSEYYITVEARDGARSSRPNHKPTGTPNREEAEVQIRITDKNDNAPFFIHRVYKASVPENTDPGTEVITVTAHDEDEENQLTYSITGGNIGNAFEVSASTGVIRVRGNLDYEEGPREYRLVYRVFDDKYANTTTVFIDVMDVNDNPPRFRNIVYNVTDIYEEEPDISLHNPKYLLTVNAEDPDTERKSRIRYDLTGQFGDDKTFVINENTGEIYLTRPLDRDDPHGRPMWNFNVLAHDEPGSGQSLTGYAEVRVMPKDINDNQPVFDRNHLTGRVPEHSRKDLSVMTVIANDVDSGNNGSVMYSLKQVPMKGSQPLFSIDTYTGLISTRLDNALDRETQPEYTLIVQAQDRGSPAESSSASVKIIINDINDHAPQFTKRIYSATMSENYPKGASITSISATDKDIGPNARLEYTLQKRDRQFFYMTSVGATNTGVLKVFRPVDYDTLLNPSFNLTVYVNDPDAMHVDTAYVEVFVTDYNDNPPVFDPPNHQHKIMENVTVGSSMAKFAATDKDTGINQKFEYAIDRATDPDRQFFIDGNGLVKTVKTLDREKTPVHRVHVLAIDKGTPRQTGTGTVILTLTDVNDNFPQFAEDYRPIIYEHEPPGKLVVTIRAIDKDTTMNGPPFLFSLPCNGGCPCQANPTCDKFAFKFENGGEDLSWGRGIVTSLQTFDREEKREYYMPIVMRDSGNPPVSGTNTLTITIGDRNDNLHYPGHKNITVYNYKGWGDTANKGGQFRDASLGNVYAEDEDDWDRGNKTFSFKYPETQQRFRLDRDTGSLYMNGRLREGVYEFSVQVHDKVHNRDVESTVAVTVIEIGDDAVFNSGSLRLSDITAEEFLERPKTGTTATAYGLSKYDLLRRMIAGNLGVPTSNVDIFTVMNHPTIERTVDIRYAAHGSPYYRPARLDGIINQNKEEFEEELGLMIAMVPIDECLDEVCESGGCANVIVTTADPLMINTNSSSLIGVTAYIKAECICAARIFNITEDKKCQPNSCLNGGVCRQRDSDFICDCRAGFDGPRCQQTRHSFRGDGWAWYKPLAQCETSHTSLEFITTSANGLLAYNGPMREVDMDEEIQDFFLLELRSGYPRLRMNHGSGEMVPLTVDGKDRQNRLRMQQLNDGNWHRIDIFRDENRQVRMVVDQCESAVIQENENSQTSHHDKRPCEAKGETPGNNKYLNVNTPLELGGRSTPFVSYPRDVTDQGFKGCIKNVIHNGELYDLHIGRVGEEKDTQDGCPREDVACGVNDLEGPKCGVNSTCIGTFHNEHKCLCNSGWRGPKCSIPTTTKDFREESFIEWDFKDAFYEGLDRRLHRTDLQLMFRTQRPAGLLFKADNAQKSEYMILEIRDRKVKFRYNLGSGEEDVVLSYINVTDGNWHTVYVERVGQWVTLRLDGGEGRMFNETFGSPSGHLHIRVSQRSLFAGGNVRFPSSNTPALVDHDFHDSCMNDVRYNQAWFPMDESQNVESRAADLTLSANLMDGCTSDACETMHCTAPLVCVDLWRVAECRCPSGQEIISAPKICVNINECLEHPCVFGKCEDHDPGFTCHCSAGFSGELCSAKSEAVIAYVSMGAILAIVICALILLLVVLLFIVYSRRRRPDNYVVGVDPEDDVRENIIHYDEEGVGEEDQDAYDINRLKKPVEEAPLKKPPLETMPREKERPKNRGVPPGKQPEVGDYIHKRLGDTDHDPNAPPHDSVREYAYEGAGSIAGSLSSLASTAEGDQSYDYLNDWGPRFSKLADMYGGAEHRNK